MVESETSHSCPCYPEANQASHASCHRWRLETLQFTVNFVLEESVLLLSFPTLNGMPFIVFLNNRDRRQWVDGLVGHLSNQGNIWI